MGVWDFHSGEGTVGGAEIVLGQGATSGIMSFQVAMPHDLICLTPILWVLLAQSEERLERLERALAEHSSEHETQSAKFQNLVRTRAENELSGDPPFRSKWFDVRVCDSVHLFLRVCFWRRSYSILHPMFEKDVNNVGRE